MSVSMVNDLEFIHMNSETLRTQKRGSSIKNFVLPFGNNAIFGNVVKSFSRY